MATAAVRVVVAGGDRAVSPSTRVSVEALATDPDRTCTASSFTYVWRLVALPSSVSDTPPPLTAAATAALFATPRASNAFGQHLHLPVRNSPPWDGRWCGGGVLTSLGRLPASSLSLSLSSMAGRRRARWARGDIEWR